MLLAFDDYADPKLGNPLHFKNQRTNANWRLWSCRKLSYRGLHHRERGLRLLSSKGTDWTLCYPSCASKLSLESSAPSYLVEESFCALEHAASASESLIIPYRTQATSLIYLYSLAALAKSFMRHPSSGWCWNRFRTWQNSASSLTLYLWTFHCSPPNFNKCSRCFFFVQIRLFLKAKVLFLSWSMSLTQFDAMSSKRLILSNSKVCTTVQASM